MKNPRITIIGLGSVGTALLNVLTRSGYEVISVFNRSEIDPELIRNFPDTYFGKGIPNNQNKLGELAFLTVSDDAIDSVVTQLSERCIDLEDKSLVHCSGVHPSKILLPLSKKGASIASFHPMKAITPKTSSFESTWFDVEGDGVAIRRLKDLADSLSAHVFKVEPKAKPLLHASAVVASNYLVVLAELVTKISALGGVPEDTALKAITPLMENTLRNVKELGVTEALTGPIARGDLKTVKQHVESLENAPELLSLYKTLGIEAVKIAVRKNGETDSLEEIRKLLS
ncbi:MAG: DUF2520 domain-containing protein [Gracilimonas sp.]|uniref:Rossmann-like and DUF2520 domain-containing protein n=1 Tax=Gracilimonas sp. TaxID=1974203 RepID=UPI001B1C1F9E|nr:Rossmann-like and DUF2520 domain-containing protein [Gracilimonas sp.]MBO6586329.1 DUF2520 domain-containing protein [Gracilimonas sp.]MBO6614986.1 DUF2520 domain-containing protein [Gracilimonas sp.]